MTGPVDAAAVRRQWEHDRAELLLHMPFLGLLALRLELVVGHRPDIPTAATNGRRIYGNVDFLAGLDAAERRFVIAHEVWHCAALHPLRRGERSAHRWNIAVDHETNAVLRTAGLSVPRDAVYFHRFRGFSAETVYEALENEPDRGRFADIHEVQLDTAAATEIGVGTGVGAGAEWRQWAGHLRAALRQANLRPGDLPGRMARDVERLLQPPLIPWQQTLRRFVGRQRGGTRSWTRPDRRHLARGSWLPGRPRDQLHLAVAVDTSRSTRRLLRHFMTELQGLLPACANAATVRVLTFDTVIQQDVSTAVSQVDAVLTEVRGGGGTDFRTVFEHLAQQPPDALILLTDGRGPRGTRRPTFPVLWVLPERGPTGNIDRFTAHEGWDRCPVVERTQEIIWTRGRDRRQVESPM